MTSIFLILADIPKCVKRIGGWTDSVVAWRAIHIGIELRWSQAKEYKNCICSFAKYAYFENTSEGNKDNVSKLSNMTVCSVNYHYKNQTKRIGLVQSGYHYHLIECNFFSQCYNRKIAHLALNNNHSLTPKYVSSPCCYCFLLCNIKQI